MADQANERLRIDAPASRIYEVAIDFERYPEWAHDIKEATIVERDDQDRATKVRYRVGAMGRTTTYTLAYDYSKAPQELSWELVQGDIMRRLDGTYVFDPVDDDSTDVNYHLTVEL